MKHKTRVNKAVFTSCGISPQASSSSSTAVQDEEKAEKGDAIGVSFFRIACACEDRTIILYDLEGKQVAQWLMCSNLSFLFLFLFLYLFFFSSLLSSPLLNHS